jgi:hypothetical protein
MALLFPKLFRVFGLCVLLACSFSAFSQNDTRGGNAKKEEQLKTPVEKKKVLIIPFDPKMYMSDIDRSINRETKMTFPQIRDALRFGLNNQLVSAFKTNYTVISLLRDTVKTKADLAFIYRATGYKYTVTQGQEKTGSQKPISNGQLTVPIKDEEERYMQTVINQPGLLEAMNKKYGAEVFVFISEVDLKGAVITDPSPMREAWVHFTVYNLQGKVIGAGLAKAKFDTDVNEPKKIIGSVFSQTARTVYTRSTLPPEAAKTPVKEKK